MYSVPRYIDSTRRVERRPTRISTSSTREGTGQFMAERQPGKCGRRDSCVEIEELGGLAFGVTVDFKK